MTLLTTGLFTFQTNVPHQYSTEMSKNFKVDHKFFTEVMCLNQMQGGGYRIDAPTLRMQYH